MILAKQVEEEELVEAVTVVSQNIKKVAISKYATIYLEARGKNDMWNWLYILEKKSREILKSDTFQPEAK